jgi:hypothetical protein
VALNTITWQHETQNVKTHNSTTQKLKRWATRTSSKTRDEIRCSRRVSSPLFLWDSRRGLIHILFLFRFLRLLYPMLPVSLDWPFLIAPSVFSNVYLIILLLYYLFLLWAYMCRAHLIKYINQGWNQVLAKGKQFPFLMRQPPCCSYILSTL